MHRTTTTAVVACAALALGACGNDDNTGSSAPPTKPAPATTTPVTAATPIDGAAQVAMKDIEFLPHDITVKVGQKIHWTNSDTVAHNVTATKGASFGSATIDAGDTYDYTPTRAGVIDYVCTIHSGQDGTITVTK